MVPRNAFRLLPSKLIDLRNAEAEGGIGAKRQTWRSRVRPPAGPCRVSGEILKSGYLVALHLEGFQSFSKDFLITNIITKRLFLMVILPHSYTPNPVTPPMPSGAHTVSIYQSPSTPSLGPPGPPHSVPLSTECPLKEQLLPQRWDSASS